MVCIVLPILFFVTIVVYDRFYISSSSEYVTTPLYFYSVVGTLFQTVKEWECFNLDLNFKLGR